MHGGWLARIPMGLLLIGGALLLAADHEPGAAPTSAPFESAAAQRLRSGLLGSKHDFTKGGTEGRYMCLPCHTPHVVRPPVPRLDRRVTAAQPLRSFKDGQIELNGWSLLCLGCHDGTTAPDVYTSSHAVSVADQLGASYLGTKGLRSHPVGIRYPAPGDKFNPRNVVEAAGLPLPDGRLQCVTCHDAHNTRGYAGMLRISNRRSHLCLTCHRR